MKVLVDASHLAGASVNRGIGTYVRGVLPLLARDPDLSLVGLAPRGTALPSGVELHPINRYAPDRWAQREHDLRLPFDLDRAARATRAHVVFSPADDPPRRSPLPVVQMLHDLIPLVVDDPAFAGAAKRWRRIGPRLRDAGAVCTNSQATANDATRLLDLDPARVHVIPLGVDPRFRPPATRERGAADDDTPTIVYVGEFGPHKGFAEAFAVAAAIANAGLPHRLAMIGYQAPWHEPAVRSLLAHAPRADRIERLGYVDDIVATYQRADALIVTSRYEGFCLPALEAMACGTPVVAFDNSAIAETVGGGGVLVADGDVEAFATALANLLRDDDAWDEQSRRGIDRAREFSWERCAQRHAGVLRAVASAR